MSQAPCLAAALRSPDLVLAAASWGAACAEPTAKLFGDLTIVATGIPGAPPKLKNRLPPCFPPHSPGGKMRLGPRTAFENP